VGRPDFVSFEDLDESDVRVGPEESFTDELVVDETRDEGSPVVRTSGHGSREGEGPIGVGDFAVDVEEGLAAMPDESSEQGEAGALDQRELRGAESAVWGFGDLGLDPVAFEEGIEVGGGDEGGAVVGVVLEGEESEPSGVYGDGA